MSEFNQNQYINKYIKEKYDADVTEEIKDYENKINRDGNKE